MITTKRCVTDALEKGPMRKEILTNQTWRFDVTIESAISIGYLIFFFNIGNRGKILNLKKRLGFLGFIRYLSVAVPFIKATEAMPMDAENLEP